MKVVVMVVVLVVASITDGGYDAKVTLSGDGGGGTRWRW